MKKLFSVIILGMFFCPLFAQEYTINMESIFSDSESTSSRIAHVKSAVDSQNNLHIVFLAFNNHTYYGTNQSGAWKFEMLKYYDDYYKKYYDVFKLPNIVVDDNNNIHIVSFNGDGKKIVYGKKSLNNREFNLKTVNISPEPNYLYVFNSMSFNYSGVDVDKNGGIHLICKADYRDQKDFNYNQSALYFNKPANTETWKLEVLLYDEQWDERNWAYGDNPSVVCYKDKVYATFGGSNELFFATRNINGGKWDIENLVLTPDDFINSKKWMTSLAVDANGSLKFAFYDETDDENSPWHGLAVVSKNSCGNKEWNVVEYFDDPLAKKTPAVAFDKNGKFYLGLGRNNYTLLHQACNCEGTYEKIYENKDNTGDFIDMVIDHNNTVYTFFTSSYDNQLYLLTAQPKGDTKKCNFPPSIVNYTGKTNLEPGEKWTATITASDSECDNIKFESIIHNEIFSIKDHGNGTATITATMPEGEGKGTPGISIWVLDEKHPDANDKVSVITYNLVITPEGQEKGSIKVKNKCTRGDNGISLNSNTNSTSKELMQNANEPNEEIDRNAQETKTSKDLSNPDCEKFLDEYQAFSEKYIPVAKKVKTNPTDIQAAMKLGNMMEDFSSYANKWVTEYNCKDIPKYQKRFEKITDEIEAAGQ